MFPLCGCRMVLLAWVAASPDFYRSPASDNLAFDSHRPRGKRILRYSRACGVAERGETFTKIVGVVELASGFQGHMSRILPNGARSQTVFWQTLGLALHDLWYFDVRHTCGLRRHVRHDAYARATT